VAEIGKTPLALASSRMETSLGACLMRSPILLI
jgi:hypothetical protein